MVLLFLYIDSDVFFSLGAIDASTVAKVIKQETEEEKQRKALIAARPPLDNVLNMHDFEVVAKTVLPDKAWVRSQIFFYVCDGATYPKALPRLTTPRHPMMKLLFGRTAWHTRGKFTLVQVSK